jgi:hypothetical protein
MKKERFKSLQADYFLKRMNEASEEDPFDAVAIARLASKEVHGFVDFCIKRERKRKRKKKSTWIDVEVFPGHAFVWENGEGKLVKLGSSSGSEQE